jgi:hypothetical protein
LIGVKAERLDSYDVLALSFYAGRGLPGTEKSNLERWYAKRDAMVYRVQFEIARHLYRFDPKADPPTETFYGNSLGRFICYLTRRHFIPLRRALREMATRMDRLREGVRRLPDVDDGAAGVREHADGTGRMLLGFPNDWRGVEVISFRPRACSRKRSLQAAS